MTKLGHGGEVRASSLPEVVVSEYGEVLEGVQYEGDGDEEGGHQRGKVYVRHTSENKMKIKFYP